MKNLPIPLLVMTLIAIIESWFLFGSLIVKNPGVAFLPRCEERILPKADIAQSCSPPSRLMKVEDDWICSCRSEADTMKGIQR